MSSIEATVRAVVEQQRGQAPYTGVGVACGEQFVQWVRDDRGALPTVEVQPGPEGPVQVGLGQEGFVPHRLRRLRRLGMLELAGPPLAPGGGDDEVVQVLVGLLAALGVDGTSELVPFP